MLFISKQVNLPKISDPARNENRPKKQCTPFLHVTARYRIELVERRWNQWFTAMLSANYVCHCLGSVAILSMY